MVNDLSSAMRLSVFYSFLTFGLFSRYHDTPLQIISEPRDDLLEIYHSKLRVFILLGIVTRICAGRVVVKPLKIFLFTGSTAAATTAAAATSAAADIASSTVVIS